MAKLVSILAILSLAALAFLYNAATESSRLSPQGCRMSYMSPSYLLQPAFDASRTPLATRYSLSLYREVGWQDNQPHGVPVLFIPGNAGSSRQVRSIASSAARQFYAAPYTLSPDFASRDLKPLDFYAVDYNEDLSAFHGPTLDAETRYAADAVAYILSLYPPNTPVVLMAHSMGGIVATSLLATLSPNVSAIITMSTPHTIPPARFDRRIANIYASTLSVLATASTPILSICGGATDLMIPSESCILPPPEGDAYRKTVFSSALEGCWTGLGHQVSVWCHQIRWRIARAALEIGAASTAQARAQILDRWLRDGSSGPPPLPSNGTLDLSTRPYQTLPPDRTLTLHTPTSSQIHLFPAPPSPNPHAFVLYLARGTIHSLGPPHPAPLRATVHFCRGVTPRCEPMPPRALKLLPDVPRGGPFPVPRAGVDEAEGIAFFEAEVPVFGDAQPTWVAVELADGDGRGWVVGGFVEDTPVVAGHAVRDLLRGPAQIPLPRFLRTRIRLPHLLSHALLVYRVAPTTPLSDACTTSLLPPLLSHSSPSETHFHPLILSHLRPLLLHAHTSAPFLPSPPTGLTLTIYASDECPLEGLTLTIAWRATFGRIALRYWTAIPGWALGVVLCTLFSAWSAHEAGAPVPTVDESLRTFTRSTLPWLLVSSFVISFLPLDAEYLLGNAGQPIFAPLAPALLIIATGLVCASWWVLRFLMWFLSKFGWLASRRGEERGVGRTAVLSMLSIFLLVFLFVPWQVAFLGCWIIHLLTCSIPTPSPSTFSPPSPPLPSPPSSHRTAKNNQSHNTHILLLLTWLLPLTAPVLAVWVRTLSTAGLTTPFDGDHTVSSVAPFLALVDWASRTRGPAFAPQAWEPLSLKYALLPPIAVSFLLGARRTYEVFDWVWGVLGLAVVVRVGPRYWGGTWGEVWGRWTGRRG